MKRTVMTLIMGRLLQNFVIISDWVGILGQILLLLLGVLMLLENAIKKLEKI